MNIYKMAFLVVVGAGVSLSLYAVYGGILREDSAKEKVQTQKPQAVSLQSIGPANW